MDEHDEEHGVEAAASESERAAEHIEAAAEELATEAASVAEPVASAAPETAERLEASLSRLESAIERMLARAPELEERHGDGERAVDSSTEVAEVAPVTEVEHAAAAAEQPVARRFRGFRRGRR